MPFWSTSTTTFSTFKERFTKTVLQLTHNLLNWMEWKWCCCSCQWNDAVAKKKQLQGYIIMTIISTLFWLGGNLRPPPLRRFFNNSVRSNIVAMKLLGFLPLPIMQLMRNSHWDILTNEGGKTIFWDWPSTNHKFWYFDFRKKSSKVEHFANFFCSLAIFDVFIVIMMFG